MSFLHDNPGIPVTELPQEASAWRRRADWILRSFECPSKQATEKLASFLEFCNGDSKLDTVTHYCKGCCSSDEEAFQKAVHLAIPLFARGFGVPLLYRFKHFAPAAGYMKFGCCTFKLLPRTLAQMERNAANSSQEAGSEIATMVQNILSQDTSADQTNAEELQRMVDSLLDNDLSYSLQNSVRRRLVSEQLSKATFLQGSMVIESLINVFEHAVNSLFKRTSHLTRLTGLGSSHPDYKDLTEKCAKSFLYIYSGDMGYDVISKTLCLLESGLSENVRMGLEPSPQRLELLFQLVCACASDVWRRLVQEFNRYPGKVFRLLRCSSLAEFVKEWDGLLETKRLRPCCLDPEFTTALLVPFGPEPLGHQALHKQLILQEEALEVLLQVATYTPVNADGVEVKHGLMQWAVSKRGNVYSKKPRAARETSILQSAIRNHGIVQREVEAITMPRKMVSAAIHRQAGVQSTNQHSREVHPNSHEMCRRPIESEQQKRQRIAEQRLGVFEPCQGGTFFSGSAYVDSSCLWPNTRPR